MANRLHAWAPAAAWASVLFLLSAIPDVPGPNLFPGVDKVAHFLVYAVLGATLAWGRTRAGGGVAHGLLLAAGALYAATDEWHQVYVPGRMPDPSDWVADVIGLMMGYALALTLLERRGSTNEGKEGA